MFSEAVLAKEDGSFGRSFDHHGDHQKHGAEKSQSDNASNNVYRALQSTGYSPLISLFRQLGIKNGIAGLQRTLLPIFGKYMKRKSHSAELFQTQIIAQYVA